MLAEANLEVASTIRVIDDVPTRTELIQYEKRFVELYQQVAWKLEETRKYYDLYNTLDSTLGFIQKEIKVLNSVSDNFHSAMRSTTAKAEFSKQFETIVKGVEVKIVISLLICCVTLCAYFSSRFFFIGICETSREQLC